MRCLGDEAWVWGVAAHPDAFPRFPDPHASPPGECPSIVVEREHGVIVLVSTVDFIPFLHGVVVGVTVFYDAPAYEVESPSVLVNDD